MSESNLTVIAYISSATRELKPEDLRSLLRGSRRRNEQRGITGVLLYHQGTFLQILEGPEGEVDALYQKIARDPRHKNIIRLMRRPAEERSFGDWSMAHKHIGPEDEELAGAYSRLLSDTKTEDDELYWEMLPSWITKLVSEFRRINR